jgi:hypothetical protein
MCKQLGKEIYFNMLSVNTSQALVLVIRYTGSTRPMQAWDHWIHVFQSLVYDAGKTLVMRIIKILEYKDVPCKERTVMQISGAHPPPPPHPTGKSASFPGIVHTYWY